MSITPTSINKTTTTQPKTTKDSQLKGNTAATPDTFNGQTATESLSPTHPFMIYFENLKETYASIIEKVLKNPNMTDEAFKNNLQSLQTEFDNNPMLSKNTTEKD